MAKVAMLAASPPALSDAVVKSAGRTIQILEFFDGIKREACVSEISRALQYPQSSTSVLLRSLVAMGYLLHDRHRRSYFPTHRVSLLGSWVDPALVTQGTLLAEVDELASSTGQRVVLARSSGLHAQYIHVKQPAELEPADNVVGVGAMRPMTGTAVGKILLSVLDDSYVSRLVRRVNAERHDGVDAVDAAALVAELQLVRRRGYVVGPGASEGQAAVAVLVRRDRDIMAVAIEADELTIETHAGDFASRLGRLAAAASQRRLS